MNYRRRLATIGLAAALAVSALAGPAFAQQEAEDTRTPEEQIADAWEEARLEVFNGVKEHAQAAVELRYKSLNELRSWVNGSDEVTPGHASALLAEYAAAENGLADLNDEIQASLTIEEALRLTGKIANDYRMYVVLVPKTAEVLIADALVAGSGQINLAAQEVQAAIDALDAYGLDVGEAQDALNNAQRYAADARANADGVADSVIALSASDWKSPAEATLNAGRADLEASADDIRVSIERLVDSIHLVHAVIRAAR